MRSWLAILTIAFLSMQSGGEHLHLCLDGGEPRVTLRADDDGGRYRASAAAGHHDVDVQFARAALAKKVSDSSDGPDLATALTFLPLFSADAKGVLQPRTDSILPVAVFRRLLPPLRGPPV